MTYPHVWQNEIVGGHTYHGMTLGGVVPISGSLTFLKNDYPGLRAIRHNGVITLATDLADSEVIDGVDDYEPGTWIGFTYQNSWKNYHVDWQDGQYRKLADGNVEFRGMVNGGAVNTVMFTLPVGFRPPKAQLFVALSNLGYSRVDVPTNGQVIVRSAGSTGDPNSWLNLSQVRYDVGSPTGSNRGQQVELLY